MGWTFLPQQPIYKQIVDHILTDIVSGHYSSGERLPSVRDLSVTAAVNPNTMQRALAELESMGLIITQRNSGKSVTENEEAIKMARDTKAMEVAKQFIKSMEALGYSKKEAQEFLAAEDVKGE
ncbi:MAG: GntR family transcriptional regulator [Clostridia bacterium]|nr:GntR family transcriptional regulator [Clostridia bacterium]